MTHCFYSLGGGKLIHYSKPCTVGRVSNKGMKNMEKIVEQKELVSKGEERGSRTIRTVVIKHVIHKPSKQSLNN